MNGAMRLYAPWGEMQPVNRPELGLKSVFGVRNSTMNLVPDVFNFAGADSQNIYNEIYTGRGRFENIKVNLISDTANRDYFLDFDGITFNAVDTRTAVRPYKGADHFWSEADKLSFEAIEMFAPDSGKLSTAVHYCPYLVEKDDIGIQTLFLSFTIYSLVTEIARTIKAISDLAGQAADGLGTGVLTTVIQAVALAVYLISMVIALINFVKELIRLYFPKLRYLKAISDYDLIRLGCEYLGYTLQSDLLEQLAPVHTMGVPITRQEDRKSIFEFVADDLSDQYFNYGYPTANDSNPLLGQFIDEFLSTWNAEAYVYDGIVRIETRTAFIQSPVATIPEVFNDQARKVMNRNFDNSADWQRKLLSWQVDYSDLHTSQNFYKTQTELQTRPITVTDPYLVKITKVDDRIFNYSLAQRKNKLNAVEKLVSTVLGIVDSVVQIFGSNGNYQSSVTARIGVIKISQDNFSITKKLWLNQSTDGNWRQPVNFIDYLGTDAIYEYHRDLEVSVNSGSMVQAMTFPCTEYEFSLFSQNKYVNLGDTGRVVQLFEATFNYRSCTSTVTYKDFDGSGFNTQTVKIY